MTLAMKAQRIFSQALLVAGSAVGAGLLALPAVTCKAGVVPSCVALLFVWMYMFCGSLLIIETASCMNPKRSAHLLSMATATLGPVGRRICLALYTVIYSATIAAYVAEGGKQAVELFYCLIAGNADDETGTSISGHDIALGQIIFAGMFARVIYRGPGDVEKLNSLFMVGVIASFITLVHSAATRTTNVRSAGKVAVSSFGETMLNATDGFATQEEEEEGERMSRLLQQDSAMVQLQSGWAALPRALPVIVVAFSYHNMISSVYSTLGRNASESSLAILLGSGISCAMYIVWLKVALGQFETTDEHGVVIPTEPLTQEAIFVELQKSGGIALPLFSFLALVTSVLGVGLGCVDFMEEAIDHSKEQMTCSKVVCHRIFRLTRSQTLRVQATVLTFGPALTVAIAFPKAFVPLLEFSGIFRLLLFGAMPVCMVWKVRSRGGSADNKSIELTKLEHYEEEFVDEKEGAGLVDELRLSHSQILPGGKAVLLGVLTTTAIIFALQINQIIQAQAQAQR